MNTIEELPPKEMAYMEYLHTPRNTDDFKKRFNAPENTVWQILRTLRLKKLVHQVHGHWQITKESDNVPPIQITPLQHEVLEYLRDPHKTTELMEEFSKSYQSSIQLIRTLRLMELVESAGRCERPDGRCFAWIITTKGLEALGTA